MYATPLRDPVHNALVESLENNVIFIMEFAKNFIQCDQCRTRKVSWRGLHTYMALTGNLVDSL